ncbi:MAG: MarP family serine protease [Saccharopolyspora sp.]|uniref:MarP family serine protease n=1 Tax=Saccharopolyspora TaxID=1835 RepID=UPI00190DE661|nr:MULTISPECIES: MarP family serine protease [unclassified Saccharopolyspora]MBK0865568.1 MarP family serine protease [Saccharopolyspora sp. HNM0986]MBQ6643213.1 MarP family serine protease [Saccharopolyspora sp.]
MNWVDLLVVALALLAAVSGARNGLVTALFSFLGVFVGAIVGLRVAPLLLERLDSQPARVGFGVGIVVLLVAFGETFGMWAGRELRDRITSAKLTGVDNVLGAVLQCAAVFVVAWLVALPFTSASAMPGLASSITRSSVLRTVDSVMPAAVKSLPDELRRMLGVSGFPDALEPFSQTPVAAIDPPDPALASSDVVRNAQTSVVKVRGRASSCARALEGTGFVVAPHRVMTNAHVVAGTDRVSIEVGRGQFDAEVVLFDPSTDVAVLSVPDLDADAMPLDRSEVPPGGNAIALGYPLDGPYTAAAGRVRERINLRGPDIYDGNTVVRDVYTVRGKVQSGNSGGPLIDAEGDVVGVVFGAAVDDPDTGFALTADEVSDEVAQASALNTPVSTGECTAG